MKQLFTLLAFSAFTFIGFGQNFEMNKDLNDGTISYQGVITADSLTSSELIEMSSEWLKAAKFKQTLDSEDLENNEKIFDIIYSVVGQKSELGNAYNYRFSTKLKLEFKEGKVRYTFYEFKKKSSPGEPGMTMEAYIENYKPKISSTRSREKAAVRLDEIELDLHDQVNSVIHDLKETFKKEEKEEW